MKKKKKQIVKKSAKKAEKKKPVKKTAVSSAKKVVKKIALPKIKNKVSSGRKTLAMDEIEIADLHDEETKSWGEESMDNETMNDPEIQSESDQGMGFQIEETPLDLPDDDFEGDDNF